MKDCEYEPQALTVEQALEAVLSSIKPIQATQSISIEAALNRVLAEDLTSQIDLPPFTNAAMDGFAVNFSQCDISKDIEIIGSSLAGHPYAGNAVSHNQCIRITTGAVLPSHCDTVIMQEHCEQITETDIKIHKAPTQGQHVRRQGEDIRKQDKILSRGKRLTPADMGLAYACGIANVNVYRQPKVAFFTTGDELRSIGTELSLGQIYDSNRLSLLGLLQQSNCQIEAHAIVSDNPKEIKATFEHSMQQVDCLITTGGVSVGAVDHVKNILNELGQLNFWRIAMKPGRPLTFGQLAKSAFFGLPGNPISVMATFYLFVLPALRKLSGESQFTPQRLTAICDDEISKKSGRTDFQRGYYYNDSHNKEILRVKTAGKQQSHILSGMSQANCFIELARDSENLSAGSEVTILPFSGFN